MILYQTVSLDEVLRDIRDAYFRFPPHGWTQGKPNVLFVGWSLWVQMKDRLERQNPGAIQGNMTFLAQPVRCRGLGTDFQWERE